MSQLSETMPKWEENEEIQIFQQYLKIPSIATEEYDYASCITFLREAASKLLLPTTVYHPGHPSKPILVMEWKGTEPGLPKIVLNSHMDVVPANENEWTYPPFAANIDYKGRIVARGAQDMKCSGMQYLAAIRALKRKNVRLKRTVLVMFVPDSKNGGPFGMKSFVPTMEFKALNIGFALDEGGPTQCETFDVYYGERTIWQLRFIINGTPGHGSSLIKDTAGEKARRLINRMVDFREKEVKRLEYQYTQLNVGDVTSINLTMIKAGEQINLIPHEMMLCFGCRLSTKVNHTEFEEQINHWMEEAGEDIKLIFDQKDPQIKPTALDNNPFWLAFQEATAELNMKIQLKISPGSTESRYMRQVGIPVIGFSPMNYTPMLAHTNNEFLSAETYLKGIEIWKKIIVNVANA